MIALLVDLQVMLDCGSQQKGTANHTERNSSETKFLQIFCVCHRGSSIFQPQEPRNVAVRRMQADLEKCLLDVHRDGDTLKAKSEKNSCQILEKNMATAQAIVQTAVCFVCLR